MSTASEIVGISKGLVNDALAYSLQTYKLADTFLNANAQKDKLDLDVSIGQLQAMKTRLDSATVDEAVFFAGDASALAVSARATANRIVNALKVKGLIEVTTDLAVEIVGGAGKTVAAAAKPLLPIIGYLVGLALIAVIIFTVAKKQGA